MLSAVRISPDYSGGLSFIRALCVCVKGGGRCLLLISMHRGFALSHCPFFVHLSFSAPRSQYSSLHVYSSVEMHVNGPLPSTRPFSIGPGSLQFSTEKRDDSRVQNTCSEFSLEGNK